MTAMISKRLIIKSMDSIGAGLMGMFLYLDAVREKRLPLEKSGSIDWLYAANASSGEKPRNEA